MMVKPSIDLRRLLLPHTKVTDSSQKNSCWYQLLTPDKEEKFVAY